MNGEYLILKVKQEKNVVIIKVVNIPDCASVNKRLISIPLGDVDNTWYLLTHDCLAGLRYLFKEEIK